MLNCTDFFLPNLCMLSYQMFFVMRKGSRKKSDFFSGRTTKILKISEKKDEHQARGLGPSWSNPWYLYYYNISTRGVNFFGLIHKNNFF